MTSAILIGQKFGSWTVLSRADNGPNWQPRWLCQCDCGSKPRIVGSHGLRHGRSTSCGCARRRKREFTAEHKANLSKSQSGRIIPQFARERSNLVGRTIGVWHVEKALPKNRKNGCYFYIAKCVNCGYKIKKSTFEVKRERECYACRGFPRGEAGFKLLYASYRDYSRKVSRDFNLTKDQFRALAESACFYCGSPPMSVKTGASNRLMTGWGTYIYNGIDRVDNSKGYTTSNCVACCEICNRAKHTRSADTFVEYIRRFAQNILNGTVPCLKAREVRLAE